MKKKNIIGIIRPIIISLIISLIIFIPIVRITGHTYYHYIEEKELKSKGIEVDSLANSISKDINLAIEVMDSFHSMIGENDPKYYFNNHFENYAEASQNKLKGFEMLVGVTNSSIEYYYPPSWGLIFETLDLFNSGYDIVDEKLDQIYNTTDIIHFGPNSLLGESPYLIAGRAIYHKGEIWGLFGIMINVSVILEQNGFLADDLSYHIKMKGPDDTVFFQTKKAPGDNIIERTIIIGEDVWVIEAQPKNLWNENLVVNLFVFIIGAFVVFILTFSLFLIIFFNQGKLKDQVEKRTLELKERTDLLEEEVKKRHDSERKSELYLDLMTHDIGNLHQGLLGNLMILDRKVNDESDRSFTDSSLDLVGRSINLVKHVKLISRLKEYDKPIERIDLRSNIEEAIVEIKKSFNPMDIKIETSYPDHDLFVMADKLVSEVIINILHNTVKVQLPNTPVIDVRVIEGRSVIRLEISDHGPGIEDSMKNIIFERYKGEMIERGRMGIGLSIVKMLMEHYNGKIWIEDRIKGNRSMGAKFIIEFNKFLGK